MPWIQRNWSADEADDWSKEDWIAIVLSPLAYILLTIGLLLACMNSLWGYVSLAAGVLAAFLLFWVINPKLEAISESYEKKQKEYLEHLHKIERWEHD